MTTNAALVLLPALCGGASDFLVVPFARLCRRQHGTPGG